MGKGQIKTLEEQKWYNAWQTEKSAREDLEKTVQALQKEI